MVEFDFSALTGYYNARINQRLVGTLSAVTRVSPQVAGTPPQDDLPWRRDVDTERQVRSALATSNFLSPSEANKALASREDTTQILAAYEALAQVKALADAARDGTLPAGQLNRANAKFLQGLDEVKSFVGQMNLEKVTLLAGEKLSKAESEAAIARSSYEYTTKTLHEGDFDAEVSAFTGSRVFTLTVAKTNTTTDLTIDLSEMGATVRNLDNVADFINSKLEAAGFRSQLERVKIGIPDENDIIAGNSFGFRIEGVSTEQLRFSAADAAPAAYLVGTSGANGDSGGQISKWTGIDGADATRALSNRLGEDGQDTDFVAVETHPEGGFVVVGTTTGEIDGQAVRGNQDVILSRYDSQGKLLWTRHLGASESATATGLAVSSDGRIAVTGVTDGDLTDSAIGGAQDGFLTVYDPDGTEAWTRQRASPFDDRLNQVAFADDGSIVVAGQTRGTFTEDPLSGGADSIVEKLDADGNQIWLRQWGTSGDDTVSAVTLAADGSVVVAGTEDGNAVVRRFASGTDDPGDWTYTLGDLQGGQVADIAFDDAGQLYLSGETRNDTIAGGQFTGGTQADLDGFAAKIDLTGPSPASAWLTRLGGAGYQAAGGLQVDGGRVYVAGTGEGAFGDSTSEDDQSAFLTAIDPDSGTQDWTQAITGRGKIASGAAVAIDTTHSATLDAFGLPSGDLVISDSARITDRLPLRPGDHFYISVDGGRARKITVEQNDTMRSLSFKMNAAVVLNGRADVRRGPDGHQLRIEPNENVKIELLPGDDGRDALAALGLPEGVLLRRPIEAGDRQSDAPEIVAMGLTENLNLLDEDRLADVADAVDSALRSLRTAYRWAIDDPTLLQLRDGNSGPGRNRDGVPPAYLQSQISNLQAGLNRLLAGGGGVTNLFA